MMNPQFKINNGITKEIEIEVANIWHLSKIVHQNNHDRMIYTAKWANKKFPNISLMIFYKYINRYVVNYNSL